MGKDEIPKEYLKYYDAGYNDAMEIVKKAKMNNNENVRYAAISGFYYGFISEVNKKLINEERKRCYETGFSDGREGALERICPGIIPGHILYEMQDLLKRAEENLEEKKIEFGKIKSGFIEECDYYNPKEVELIEEYEEYR
jgi:hypothetical protein